MRAEAYVVITGGKPGEGLAQVAVGRLTAGIEQLAQLTLRSAGRLQQQLPLAIEHLEAQLAFVGVAGQPATDTGRLVERLLQAAARFAVEIAYHQALNQPRAVRQLRIEQLLGLVASVAVALPGDQRQRQHQRADHQRQGAAADRAPQHHLSTR